MIIAYAVILYNCQLLQYVGIHFVHFVYGDIRQNVIQYHRGDDMRTEKRKLSQQNYLNGFDKIEFRLPKADEKLTKPLLMEYCAKKGISVQQLLKNLLLAEMYKEESTTE